MKFELKRTGTKKEKNIEIEFKMIFTPENVEDTLKLKELEKLREHRIDGSYINDKWEEMKFIIILY